MQVTSPLWAAVTALAIATSALWANPKRGMNRALAALSVYVAGWMLVRHAAMQPEGVDWLRWSWVVAGFLPVALWLVRDALLNPEAALGARLRRAGFWWLVPAAFSAPVWWDETLRPGSHPGTYQHGDAFHVMVGIGIAAQAVLAVTTLRKLRGRVGAGRLDLQLLVMGGATAVTFAYILPALGAVLRDPSLARIMPLGFVALLGGMVWSLLTTRVLDARHIVTIALEKLVLVAGVTVFIWGIQQLLLQFVPEWLSYGLSVALGLWFAAEVRPWLQELSQRKPAAERVRRAAYEVARRDPQPQTMEREFLELVMRWSDCERVAILMPSQGQLAGGGVRWPLDLPELRLLQGMRWATPERLERERPRPHGEALGALMRSEGFGLLVASGGPSLSCVLALGIPRSHQPYTYPKITTLLTLQSIIESSLSRAQYLANVQHAEKLATVGLLGASVAHEIRNPLVSIKTFVQLLPGHYQEQAFRDKFFRLIGDEVTRIDRLTQQLLDLAAPRVLVPREVDLHELLAESIDLLSSKAEDKRVALVRDFSAEVAPVWVDPGALKQVVMNLALNAIQAVEQLPEARQVRFSTRPGPGRVELAISDNGPGIDDSVRERLFQPFQSTKSSGFGLGLAICKDILSSLHASISADASAPGSGATFRIVLPCQPPTS